MTGFEFVVIDNIWHKGIEQDDGTDKKPPRYGKQKGIEDVTGGKEGINDAATEAQCKNTPNGGPFFAFFARDPDPKWNGQQKCDEKGQQNLAYGVLFGEQKAVFVVIKRCCRVDGAAYGNDDECENEGQKKRVLEGGPLGGDEGVDAAGMFCFLGGFVVTPCGPHGDVGREYQGYGQCKANEMARLSHIFGGVFLPNEAENECGQGEANQCAEGVEAAFVAENFGAFIAVKAEFAPMQRGELR